MKHVVVETVLFVPQLDAFTAAIIHRVGDVDEVFEKLTGDAFVGWILARQFERNREHIQAVHSHPARAVRLLQMAASRERCGTIEDSDVVQTEKTTLKNIHALGVFAVYPPGEVEQKFVEDAF